ncbi:O-antigen ligase family protein [Pseudonocardia tropica]|uniref:O-antigen ligase family protein n=1 Tax=Pseudonocardia tropica TaxID=681289 RepID=A0ABV1JXG6_9PSEU
MTSEFETVAPSTTGDAPRRPAATFCAFMVIASLVLPANLVLGGPLRSLGSASRVLGLLALILVLVVFVQQNAARSMWGTRVPGSRVVPAVLIVYTLTMLALHGAGERRLMSSAEADGGTRFLIGTLAMLGVGLAVALFVSTRRDLHTVMRAVTFGAAFSALVGIIQSRTTLDLAAILRLPGLALSTTVSTELRNDLTRVIGSAAHPIEFSVIMGAAVPVALWLTTYSATTARRQAAGVAVALLLIAVPFGISRSGILGLLVALGCYAMVWSWRQRLTALACALGGLIVYRFVQPGILGTLFGLFTNASTDNSVLARQQDYPRVDAMMEGRELFGIGPGTFQPDVYFILDNQFLGSYVEGGVVGVVAFASVPTVGLVVAHLARRRATDRATRDAAQAVFAAIAGTTVCGFTFDLLAFQQVAFLLFVYVGLASAILVVAATGVATPEKTETGVAAR